MPYQSLRRLQLPPGSLSPLLAHGLIFIGLLLRILSGGKYIIIAISYPLIAWSMPFFLLSTFIFPVGLPSLNPFGSKFAPARFRSLRVVNDRLAAFLPLMPFLLVALFILFWAVNGDVDSWDPHSLFSIFGFTTTVAPIEARTSLAVSILAVILLGWLMGDASLDTGSRELDIEVAARLERIRMVRHFATEEGEVVPLLPMEELLYSLIGTTPCSLMNRGNESMLARGRRWEASLKRWRTISVHWRAMPWLARRWP